MVKKASSGVIIVTIGALERRQHSATAAGCDAEQCYRLKNCSGLSGGSSMLWLEFKQYQGSEEKVYLSPTAEASNGDVGSISSVEYCIQ